ncbi:MAG TPA: glycosyltransferase family 4 protein [Isosphaeraceae bacterium]|nr:glycosyltransferase family 4 protein [Isosphaeraceae bacterium]
MSCLRVCIVGGIFDKPDDYRRLHQYTPETILAQGLAERGVDVAVSGHRGFVPLDHYDIVHVHHLGKAALAMASASTRSMFIYTGHDGRLINGYTASRKRKLATGFITARADAIVALSDFESSLMQAAALSYARKWVTIPNGIPTDIFYAPQSSDNPQPGWPPRLLFVGQLIPLKGLHVLLEAVKLLTLRTDVELRLVYHNDQHEPRYRDMATCLGITDKVHFLGIKSPGELAEIYRSADLLVLPSFAEALPSVITEAMMCGLPIVATQVGGIPDQVGPHGYLVRPGDAAGLAAAIGRALGDIARRGAPRAEISRYATERFSIAAMVQSHLELYRSLLENGQAPARLRMRNRLVNKGVSLLLGTFGSGLSGRGLLE